jgi:hypothetical protein
MSTPAVSSSGTALAAKEAILTLLGIGTHLCDRSDQSLHVSYQKYKAHLEASQTYERMIADGSWTGNKLTAVDLIELFVSKSFWHSHVRRYFSQVPNHPLLVSWLENKPEDRPSDLDVWGIEKSGYTFKDLDMFLQRADGKGKKKDKESHKKQKDKKSKKQVK